MCSLQLRSLAILATVQCSLVGKVNDEPSNYLIYDSISLNLSIDTSDDAIFEISAAENNTVAVHHLRGGGAIRQNATRPSVLYYHVRKAGGTSIRNYLKTWAEEADPSREKPDISVREGVGYNKSETTKSATPDTILLINFRDPYTRVQSAYSFEGRWGQRVPPERRLESTATSLEEWLTEKACENPGEGIWQCTQNYYVKLLNGWGTQETKEMYGGSATLGLRQLEIAKRVLRTRFDLIVITEQMGSPGQLALVDATFCFDHGFPHKRVNEIADENRFSHVDPTPIDSVFTEKVKRRIQEMNALDYELYKYAKELNLQRINALSKQKERAKADGETGQFCYPGMLGRPSK